MEYRLLGGEERGLLLGKEVLLLLLLHRHLALGGASDGLRIGHRLRRLGRDDAQLRDALALPLQLGVLCVEPRVEGELLVGETIPHM